MNYDIVINNGMIVDPLSQTQRKMNLGITDGKIATLSTSSLSGMEEIDADGLVVAPGFIDVHTHADGIPASGPALLKMGVTSAIGGNCGYFQWLTDEKYAELMSLQGEEFEDAQEQMHHIHYLLRNQLF